MKCIFHSINHAISLLTNSGCLDAKKPSIQELANQFLIKKPKKWISIEDDDDKEYEIEMDQETQKITLLTLGEMIYGFHLTLDSMEQEKKETKNRLQFLSTNFKKKVV